MPKRQEDQNKPVIQKRPGFFTRSELSRWLGASRNSVQEIARRFNIRSIEGLYPEDEIFRKVLGIAVNGDAERALLRVPLKNARWVSRETGVPGSTLRRKVREGSFAYTCGIQLGAVSTDGCAARSRRWIPCIVQALARGEEPPHFTPAVAQSFETERGNNPLADLIACSARSAPHRPE
jgi:hypothetical protein